jgi:predicted nucleic acid-binding protein
VDILADTNVILRRLHRAHPQHRQARDAIKKFSTDGNRVCVTSQNLIELWVVCTRPIESNGLGLSPSQADRVVARVENSVFRLSDSDNVYGEWRRLVVANGVSGKKAHDARIVAAMTVHGVTHILTFDRDDFSRYSAITVLDPTKP